MTENIAALRQSFRSVNAAHPFVIAAVVILPDHLHAILTLPDGDDDFSLRWRQIKSKFSRAIDKGERISNSRARKHERGIWQRRFWEHVIRDDNDFEHHADYIHHNPVKHGLVGRVADWPFSSFHRFVRLGIYSDTWAGDGICDINLELLAHDALSRRSASLANGALHCVQHPL